MRTKTLAIIATVALAAFALNVQGQRGYRANRQADTNNPRNMGQCMLTNLTPEQETQLQDMRTKHLKEVTPLRNELQEKRARLNTLQSAEKPDMGAINKLIDEIGTIRTNLTKKQAAHRNEVSNILTEEQRVQFNARRGGMGMGGPRGAGMKKSNGRGMKRGW